MPRGRRVSPGPWRTQGSVVRRISNCVTDRFCRRARCRGQYLGSRGDGLEFRRRRAELLRARRMGCLTVVGCRNPEVAQISATHCVVSTRHHMGRHANYSKVSNHESTEIPSRRPGPRRWSGSLVRERSLPRGGSDTHEDRTSLPNRVATRLARSRDARRHEEVLA